MSDVKKVATTPGDRVTYVLVGITAAIQIFMLARDYFRF